MPVSQEDLIVIKALFLKFRSTYYAEQRLLEQRAAVDERLKAYKGDWKGLRAAFAMYGLKDFTKESWDEFRVKLGEAAFKAMLDFADNAPAENASLEAPSLALEEHPDEVVSGTIREIVLDQLQKYAPSGVKAGQLREIIEKARGTQLHEKTVGMTLYRLSQEGLAHREGRTWFFVSPDKVEAMNPGGETPGPINRDDKKGEEP